MDFGAASVASDGVGYPPSPSKGGAGPAGIKGTVEKLSDVVRLHGEALAQHAEAIRATGSDASAAVFTMEANMKAFINEVKRDLIMKINALAADVQSIQQQINVLKGDQGVVAQQSRDTSRRLDELSVVVSGIQSELLG